MNRTAYSLALLSLTILLTGCSDPLVGIPGKALSGDTVAIPESWTDVPDVVQLELRPSEPYSINIWAVTANNHLYVATEGTKWIPFISEDNRVKVRMDSSLYELVATLAIDPEERRSVGNAFVTKYDYELSEEDMTNMQVFRLTAK